VPPECGNHVQNVGVSLLTTIGHTELIAWTEEQYADIAVSLANDPERLTHLRQTLRQSMMSSPLGDGKRYVRNAEALMLGMWQVQGGKVAPGSLVLPVRPRSTTTSTSERRPSVVGAASSSNANPAAQVSHATTNGAAQSIKKHRASSPLSAATAAAASAAADAAANVNMNGYGLENGSRSEQEEDESRANGDDNRSTGIIDNDSQQSSQACAERRDSGQFVDSSRPVSQPSQ
jgi:hypothetical protein